MIAFGTLPSNRYESGSSLRKHFAYVGTQLNQYYSHLYEWQINREASPNTRSGGRIVPDNFCCFGKMVGKLSAYSSWPWLDRYYLMCAPSTNIGVHCGEERFILECRMCRFDLHSRCHGITKSKSMAGRWMVSFLSACRRRMIGRSTSPSESLTSWTGSWGGRRTRWSTEHDPGHGHLRQLRHKDVYGRYSNIREKCWVNLLYKSGGLQQVKVETLKVCVCSFKQLEVRERRRQCEVYRTYM